MLFRQRKNPLLSGKQAYPKPARRKDRGKHIPILAEWKSKNTRRQMCYPFKAMKKSAEKRAR